ncbi:hypothetical protein GH714_031881 [Hevea brasiliensis]|uniref:Terpene synthase N-terminal domain-containing protein n=1 Tax=Hevea brasiliensis TaxID=3981 RepID=A0A6A6LSR2_HEVBR|nr:hypothetical protein GH714_031881 [Hevea brasiliensis]
MCSFLGETNRLAYVAEGLTRLNDWQELMKYQRSNGSLFNSPSATAAALTHLHDEKCLEYLSSLVKKFDNAVPTIYPLDIYPRLHMIDNLIKLGIDRHFTEVIATTLDDIYRSWMQGSEEIFLDPACCALGFRLLRMNGYEISSDALANFDKQENILNSMSDINSALELYKASQMIIFPNEPVLERIYDWTRTYLENELVDYALKHPYASLERTESRRYIENYNVDNISLLKTSYRYFNIDNRDLLTLSFQDFNKCQAIHREELDYLESPFPPDLSDARISWAQNTVLTTVVDDFFDFAGSMEELLNLIELIQRWDEHSTIGFKSKDVEILFYAIYGTTNDLADKASKQQGRCVKKHLIDIVRTPEQAVETQEYNNLFMHVSIIGRLLNDCVTVAREGAQGKLNSVSLAIVHGRGAVTEKEAQEEVTRLIESHRRELLRMVQQTKGSVVPKDCKDLFWKMSKVLHLFYMGDDKYSSPHKMVSAVNEIINEPILLPPYSKLD